METKHLPRRAGIYQIVNTVTGKVYVGSAMDIQVRIHRHRGQLRAQTHRNTKIQHAWDKYGAESFVARVIEEVTEPTMLVEREQHWIDLLQSVKNGYNIVPTAGSQLGFRYSPASLELATRVRAKPIQGFIAPDGAAVTILNLGLFCKANGLTANVMRMLTKGKATSHKGWTHVNAKQPAREWIKTYEGFIDPQGNPVGPITNLEQFCAEHGLIASNMNKVHRGAKPSHCGWTHVDSVNKRHAAKRVQTYRGFINPQGEAVTITNLTKFCRDNGLDHATMWRVLQGKAPQHKGWTYRPESEDAWRK